MDSGVLYIVYNKWIIDPETKAMPYKIGITSGSVADRYYGLGLKMPGQFETHFAYKIDKYTEAEKSIHNILDKYRINGEWFNLSQKELDLVENICETMGGIIVTEEIKYEIHDETEEENDDDFISNKIENSCIIEYIPDRITFRKNLLKYRKANYTLVYDDGHTESGVWDARKITENSSISGNIRSGYLRDWREKGITKGIFEIKDV
jgi:hypothetical protein